MKFERFLLLNIAFSVFIGLFVGTSSGGDARKTLCLDRERQALLKFKQALIDNYGILSSWGREEERRECCSWKGVKCSNRTGHVVVLDIHTPQPIHFYSDPYLRGNITPSLVELQHLKYLDLSYIDFGGSQIPDFIGSFPRLEYLNLHDANFSGELPNCWTGFEEIVILNLANNNLHGKIPGSIGSLLSIGSLQLRTTYFTGALPTSLKNCEKLKILDVGENKLSGEIPLWIGSHLTNLVILSLRVNRFNGSIPPNLCHPNQVHILDLSQNSFMKPINIFMLIWHENKDTCKVLLVIIIQKRLRGKSRKT